MKKSKLLISILVMFFIAGTISTQAQISEKQREKQLAKQTKETVKRFNKADWEIYGSTESMDQNVYKTLKKLNSGFYSEISATATGSTVASAVDKARSNATEAFTELIYSSFDSKYEVNTSFLESAYIVTRKLRKKPYEAMCVYIYDMDKVSADAKQFAENLSGGTSDDPFASMRNGVYITSNESELLYGTKEELSSFLSVQHDYSLSESKSDAKYLININAKGISDGEEEGVHGYVFNVSIILTDLANSKMSKVRSIYVIGHGSSLNFAKEKAADLIYSELYKQGSLSELVDGLK